MRIIKLVSGMIFNDEFDSTELNSRWDVIPNLPLRYSLIEKPGYLQVYHGSPDLMFLFNEPNKYIMDIRNEYVPQNDGLYAGVIAFKSKDECLEVLEYYDVESSSSSVYEYIRLIKDNNLYTAYGKNHEDSEWQLVGCGEFISTGKAGIVVRGPSISGSSTFSLDYVRLYKAQNFQIINVPVGYKVQFEDALHNIKSVQKVNSTYNGVSFNITEVPPYKGYLKIFDNTGVLISQSDMIEFCGGDVFFYGANLDVKIDGKNIYSDKEYFLGYFHGDSINFVVTLTNTFSCTFENVSISAQQVLDLKGYENVSFCLDEIGNYVQNLQLGNMAENSTVTIYGRVNRSQIDVPSSTEPYRFNLKVLYD